MNPEQRRVLADLLIKWEDLYRQGQDTPAELLCKGHPELTETLGRQITALKRVAWLDNKLEDDDDDHADNPPEDSRPPKLLAGRYRLDHLIATGGFAEVWRAFDQELQRIIAVKIPKRTVIGSSESFLAEARRVARLKHPGIIPIHDVGLENGECFFVTEYVEGGSFTDRLTHGKLSVDHACQWIGSIADALDHAHRAGVVHRDVKPANILIDAHDRALLADFGIAQSSMKTGAFAPSLGTLRYMAPEQLDGQSAVPQSDIYSLAVVLHEALTGKTPYSSGAPNTLRREIGSGAKVSKDVPQRLAPILRKALQKDPGQRFESAAEFASSLRKVSRPAPWRMPLGAVAAFGIVLGLFAWRQQPKQSAMSPSQAVAASPAIASPMQPPNVIRREMPYPLPPFNRRAWIATSPERGRTFRFDPESGHWGEENASGNTMFWFTQTRITADTIDLADPHRPVWIRLRRDRCEICDAPDFKVTGDHARGAWADADGSPYPPELDTLVTVSSRRDTLEVYVRRLAGATGIPFMLYWNALTLQGITKNQSFPFEAKDQPARDILMALLRKADSENRLRAVLRATDDGRVGIDITTTQSLGE